MVQSEWEQASVNRAELVSVTIAATTMTKDE